MHCKVGTTSATTSAYWVCSFYYHFYILICVLFYSSDVPYLFILLVVDLDSSALTVLLAWYLPCIHKNLITAGILCVHVFCYTHLIWAYLFECSNY